MEFLFVPKIWNRGLRFGNKGYLGGHSFFFLSADIMAKTTPTRTTHTTTKIAIITIPFPHATKGNINFKVIFLGIKWSDTLLILPWHRVSRILSSKNMYRFRGKI